MQLKTSLLATMCASLLLSACVSNPPVKVERGHEKGDVEVYEQQGMEISAITYQMADELQRNLFYYLLPDSPIDPDDPYQNVKIVTMPRIAITSFVDTDTYENAGYLGRTLSELFTHEMSSRAFEVTEYKLTGSLAVSRDGEYIMSRNWKKIASDTHVKYLLGGTLSRNDKGVVVVARLINMQTRQTIATSTGFIPYEYLPFCYRTVQKNCSFEGIESYDLPQSVKDARLYKKKYEEAQAKLDAANNLTRLEKERLAEAVKAEKARQAEARGAMTRARIVSASGQPLGGVFVAPSTPPEAVVIQTSQGQQQGYIVRDGTDTIVVGNDPRYTSGTVQSATSRGTYDLYKAQDPRKCTTGACDDPVAYPANTYMHNTLLIRDTADESSYKRVAN